MDRLTALVAVGVGATLVAGVATAVARLDRPVAGDVVRALDGVDGLQFERAYGAQTGLDPCRVSAMLQAAGPRTVLNRLYVAGANGGIVTIGVHDFADPDGAAEALRATEGRLAQCRGFRSVSARGEEARFFYGSLGRTTGLGAEGYVVGAIGATASGSTRYEFQGFLFRRGQFVLSVGWQSERAVDTELVSCLAARADAGARGSGPPRCSAVSGVST